MKTAVTERTVISNEKGPFLELGFGFVANMARVTCIMPFIGKTSQRLYRECRDTGYYYDATRGRAKKSLVVLDNGYIIGSAYKPETIVSRQF